MPPRQAASLAAKAAPLGSAGNAREQFDDTLPTLVTKANRSRDASVWHATSPALSRFRHK